MIDQIGADNFVFGTALGQVHNLRHIEGIKWAIQLLLSYGAKKEDVRKILKINTARHLEIEPEL
jgi:microsomal dipeptidase-like Zn-dependent dipeptidase